MNHAELLSVPSHRFVEPFVGSGAVYFHIEPSLAVLSDSNKQLIETYKAVRDEPERVLEGLRQHQRKHCRQHYYSVRASRPRSTAALAARFIYLNRTCFNGLYRVNLKGEFNVPKGTKESVLLPDDDFVRWADLLQGASLIAQDFEKTINECTSDDLVYVDPPYTVKHNNNNFIKYNECIFSWADQERLRDCLLAATQRGSRVIISNADHPSIRALYSVSGWMQITINRHSGIAASSANRKSTTEIIISNFLNKHGKHVKPRACRRA